MAMATLLARLPWRADQITDDAIPGIDLATPEEARALFDRRARQLLHISGEEFLLPAERSPEIAARRFIEALASVTSCVTTQRLTTLTTYYARHPGSRRGNRR